MVNLLQFGSHRKDYGMADSPTGPKFLDGGGKTIAKAMYTIVEVGDPFYCF